MIDPNELRLGNLVRVSDRTLQVVGVGKHHIGLQGLIPIEEIDPIPITPEWLERMGIYWDIYWQGRTDGNWVITEGNEHGNWRIAYGKRRNDIIMWNLKYVHQLQNLYFALTGEELTIRPE